MNGATADPCVKTTRPPRIAKNKKIGYNQNFLRNHKNAINSKIILFIQNQNWFFMLDMTESSSDLLIQYESESLVNLRFKESMPNNRKSMPVGVIAK